MKKKLFFWADASQSIGYGHFIRTSTLAEMMKDDFDCTFFTTSPNQYQLDILSPICKCVALPERNDKFDIFLSSLSEDITVFLDGYFFDGEFQKRVKERCKKLVCMADTVNHFYADIVLGYVVNSQIIDRERYTKLYQGVEWIVIREPFLTISNKHSDSNKVVLCFGGTDQFKLTEKFVDFLLYNYHFDLSVVSSFEDKRVNCLSKRGVSVFSNISAMQLAQLFSESLFAIVSSSIVAIESIVTHTPTITGYYMDNQKMLYRSLIDNQYAIGIGDLLSYPACCSICSEAISSLKHFSFREINYSLSKNKYISLFNE